MNVDKIASVALRKAGYRRTDNPMRVSAVPVEWDGTTMCDWIEREFYIPEMIGKPNPAMPLMPYHRAVLTEACRTGEDGRFMYDLVLWSDIKKSIKSSIAAAVTLFRALHAPYFSAKLIGNDLKQADSRVFGYAARAVDLNPRLKERCTVKNHVIMIDNRSVIEAIPVDPSGEAGGNDDFIEFTELHAATSKKHGQMWTEMTISPTKRGFSQRWIDTYAGYAGESPVLEPLYETVVKEGHRVDVGIPNLELYANGATLALWNTVPRCPWQDPSYYASESKALLPNEFRRIHQNQWVSSEDIFVSAPWWHACKGDIPAMDKFKEVVVALDASVSGDCFGILAVSRGGIYIYQRFVKKWIPPKNGTIIYTNVEDPEDPETPEGTIRQLARDFNVIAYVYDPYQLHSLCTRLQDENIGYFIPMNQGNDRLKADKQLWDAIRDKKIQHDGNADLEEHILNANAKKEGDKLRIVKRSERLKIDLAVCLSMATDKAYELLPE